MRNRFSPLIALCAAALTFGAALPAQADDTEIYIGQPTEAQTGTRPNILFVMDTSGSMGTEVDTQPTYDPKVVYEGDCDNPDMIFWKKKGFDGPPVNDDCNFTSDNDATVGVVPKSAFFCKSAQDVIDVSGFQTVSGAAQWRPRANRPADSRWTSLDRERDDKPYYESIECKDDSELDPPHGNGTRSYARNGKDGPWTDEAAEQISWATDDVNDSYTFYSTNYLNWYHNAAKIKKSRLDILKESLSGIISRLSQANVGLMRFDTDGNGGMVIKEMEDIATSRQDMLDAIADLDDGGNTPLSETYYEALLYWRGLGWDYGSRSEPQLSIPESRKEGVYISPVAESCQKNFIVLLTDGEPVSDTGVDSDRRAKLTGFPEYLNEKAKVEADKTCTPHPNNTGEEDGRCLDDLAGFAHDKDQIAGAGTPGSQTITTYTVGFGGDVQSIGWAVDVLDKTAERGGGEFFRAEDTASLTNAFNSIISEILSVNTTFTAPTVAVNAFNRTQNLDDLYITVFGTPQPADAGNKYHWPGNIKKYEIEPDGTIIGADGNPVVDTQSGFFSDNARSFWSDAEDEDDGAEVELGGAAHQIPAPGSRKVYTDAFGDTLKDNSVEVATTAITADMLGIDAASKIDRDNLILWVRGADIDPTLPADQNETKPARHQMGDPLHGRPATVVYGGTEANPDLTLFAVTNDGFLHAIDTDDGSELWAFIPGQMLRRMDDLYENATQPAKRYALDGNIRAFKLDENNNGIVDGNDKVYLFFGMGRGGESYYALDVTNRSDPRLLWRRGSANELKADGTTIAPADQLPGLGQTWSTPVITNVNIDGTVRLVAIFAGGYDPSQDNLAYNTDDVGNRIYMLDAVSGTELWRAGPDTDTDADLKIPTKTGADAARSMNNSIPADVRVIDLDGDQLADRMYAADTGGRVWRFDIHNGQKDAELVRGGVFASLGRAGDTGTDPTDARRFYYAPDVSMIKENGSVFLNIAIGSGYRGHPLDMQIHDRFYALRDRTPFVRPSQDDYDTFAFITDTDTNLVDVTTNIKPTMTSSSLGWKMDLSAPSWAGEKVLAESITFAGTIIFTTYLPQAGDALPNANVCIARQGQNRLYAVSARDGSPVLNRDNSADAEGNVSKVGDEVEDRWGDLNQSGIAPEAVILFPETSAPTCIVGVESCGVGFTNNPVRTFWYQRDTEGSN